MTVLPDILKQVAQTHKDKIALLEGSGRSLSFQELAHAARAFASQLQSKGLEKGARVLVAAPIGVDLYVILAGLWSAGCVAVFPEPQMGLKGLRHAMSMTKPVGFAYAGAYHWLRALPALWSVTKITLRPYANNEPSDVNITPQDPALISFTSGSTGLPKGIERTHAFLMAQHAAVSPLLESDTDEKDLVAFPVFALINLAAGRTSVLPDWPLGKARDVSPAHLSGYLRATGCTRALLPPALCETLAQISDMPPLHHVFSGGGPIFPDMMNALAKAAPNLALTCVYGSTEAEPIAHLHASDISSADYDAMAAGAGLLAGDLVPEIKLRLQSGEIQVAGAHVNVGYLDPSRDGENKIRDGETIWHRTGDAGKRDEKGRLWLLGRSSATLSYQGHTLYPFCIETAARLWPGVKQAALGVVDGTPVLAIKGERSHFEEWKHNAAALGVPQVRPLRHLPYDKRHGSKIDLSALNRLLAQNPRRS